MSRPSFTMPRDEIVANLVAGLIVGVVAIPLSIALAVAVGVPPIVGLYTAAFAGGVAAVFGGSRFNITGPTAALVPLLAHAVLQYGVEVLPLLGVMSGLILVGMWRLRLGRLVRFMPGLVVVGFTAGIALSIAFGQVNTLLAVTGTNPSLEHFHEKLIDTVMHLSTVQWETPLLGLFSVAFLLRWQRTPKRIPGPLIVVVVATVLAQVLGIDTPTVGSRYGELPRGFPIPDLNFLRAVRLDLIIELAPLAMSVAILSGVESLLSAVVADNMAPAFGRHDPDRELLGQGLANLVAPIMGGMPATAAIARTATGIRNGATSRLAGVAHAVTVLAITLLFSGLGAQIPLSALAAILIVVAWNIADFPEVTHLLRGAPREDLVALLGTALMTLFFDLTYAIGFGIVASIVLLLRRLTRMPSVAAIVAEEAADGWIPDELVTLLKAHPDVAFFNVQGVLSFHSAAEFERALIGHDHRPLVLRMRDLHHIDASGLIMLRGIIDQRRHAGARIVLTDVQPEVLVSLRRFGIIGIVGPAAVFARAEDAVAALTGSDDAMVDVAGA